MTSAPQSMAPTWEETAVTPATNPLALPGHLKQLQNLLKKNDLLTEENATVTTLTGTAPRMYSGVHIQLKNQKKEIVSLSFDPDLLFIAPAGKQDLPHVVADTYLSYMRIPGQSRVDFDIQDYGAFGDQGVAIVKTGDSRPLWKIKLLGELNVTEKELTLEQMEMARADIAIQHGDEKEPTFVSSLQHNQLG